MSAAAPFGLYPSAACIAAQKLGAGTSVPLLQPSLDAAGVTRFRRSYWLPVPERLHDAAAARLVASALGVRFAPAPFDVAPGNTAWLKRLDRDGNTTRIELAWPAPLRRVNRTAAAGRYSFGLHRVDGDAVASEAAQSGITGQDLTPPFVGASFEVRLGEPVLEVIVIESVGVGVAANVRGARAAPASGGAHQAEQHGGAQSAAQAAVLSANLSSLSFDGVPTTPRLRLVAEQPGGAETLLWQELQPGAQTAPLTLPSQAVAAAWQPAIEQLLALATGADSAKHPERLRLDIESDAPCAASFSALALALEIELELLAAPAEVAFDGIRVDGAALPIVWPASLPLAAATALTLRGHVAAEAGADALGAGAPADARRGALVEAGQAALHALDLAAPARLAGVTLCWRPMSSRLAARLRLLADGDGAPAAHVLAQAELAVDTPGAGWIAVRWPALELQAQRVWLEWSLAEGAGLWLFAAAGSAAGWVDTRGGTRRNLPEPLAFAPLPAPAAGETQRPIRLAIGPSVLAEPLAEGALEVVLRPPALEQLAERAILVAGGTRGKVTVESARLALAT